MTNPIAYTIENATKITGLGRTTIYAALAAGNLRAVKAGNRTLIMADSLSAFMASLPAARFGAGSRQAPGEIHAAA